MASETQVLAAALSLDGPSRQRVARRLLDSLGDGFGEPPLNHAWAETIDRRLAEIDAGTADLVPADEAFGRARTAIRP